MGLDGELISHLTSLLIWLTSVWIGTSCHSCTNLGFEFFPTIFLLYLNPKIHWELPNSMLKFLKNSSLKNSSFILQ